MQKREELMEALKDFFDNPNLQEEIKLESDYLDSFEKMSLLAMLEEVSRKDLSIIELFECDSFGDVLNLCM